MTPTERKRNERDRIFQAGWDNAAKMPPLTERQVERCAFLIAPAFDATPAALPTAA